MITSRLLGFSLIGLVFLTLGCSGDDPAPFDSAPDFLTSEVAALGDVEFPNFTIPENYDLNGALAPGAYDGQVRRLAQLQEIVDSSSNEPIYWDLRAALANEDRGQFNSAHAQGDSDLRTKIDELAFDAGDTRVADDFGDLADSLVQSSQAHYTQIASNGKAGMINSGGKKRHVSSKGLEYIQMLEKGLYGALFYDQMVDDYLRISQSGMENPLGNNESAAGSSYAELGTDRQHRFDEAFGYLGANPLTYPNPMNTSNGDGSFIANYTFDFSDELEEAFGVNLAQQLMNAFIFGRSVLKAGQGFGPQDETTNEVYFEAARQDIKTYTEVGLACAAFHYLNAAIADITDEDKIHHLSEALAFIYTLGFNDEGMITPAQVHDVLQALGWSDSESGLTGVYDINLWEVTDEQMETARTLLDQVYPGLADLPL